MIELLLVPVATVALIIWTYRHYAGDEARRREIESLLGYGQSVERAIETSAMEGAAPFLADAPAVRTVPETIGHYRILRLLGQGGMGEVYLASDLILDRHVAVKVLRPEILQDGAARARFLREARAVATLNHVGIAAIYEAGECNGLPYLAMEYVGGRTLQAESAGNPLDEQVLLSYAQQIASALEQAHVRGIVHRDIKSANVLVTPEGAIKLTDFGLARLLRPIDETMTVLTAQGTWVGTLQYAAPESLTGSPADHRSDLYSLGVVLYEMAAGRLPYGELTGTALLGAILRGDAPPLSHYNPTISPALTELIERAMALRPEQRFQTATELLAAMRALPIAPTAALSRSPALHAVLLAIVDFQNISNDATVDWLGTGIAETLGNDLQKLPSVRVVSRQRMREALQRLGSQSREGELGRAVKAHWLVSGSYQRSGDRLRITFRLLHVPSDEIVFVSKVDGKWENIFETQDQVVRQVVEHLPVQIDKDAVKRVAVPETLRVEAYEQYALGRQKMLVLGKDALEEARQHFERAVALDSHYAAAYSALGCAHAFRFIRRTDPEDLTRAARFLEEALQLDPELGEPYPFLCYIYMRQNRPQEAIAAGQQAVDRQPDLHFSHYFLGATYLVYVERDSAFLQLAVDHLMAAAHVEPRYEPIWFLLCTAALAAGDYGQVERFAAQLDELAHSGRGMRAWFGPGIFRGALWLRRSQLERSLETYLDAFDQMARGDHVYREPIMALCACGASEACLRQGRAEQALAEARRAWNIVTEFPRMLGHERVLTATLTALACAYAAQGDSERADSLLQQAVMHFTSAAKMPGSYMFGASTPDLAEAVGRAHLRCQRPEPGFKFLEDACRFGWRDEQWWRLDPELAPLRDTGALDSFVLDMQALPALKWP